MPPPVDRDRIAAELWRRCDLSRAALCRRGPEHDRSRCLYAHSLLELRSPIEHVNNYADRWQRGEFDRFYGQRLRTSQVELFEFYYCRTLPCDLPTWAIGLHLLLHGRECSRGYVQTWDFGLISDYRGLIAGRRDSSAPFQFMDYLWERLHARRLLLEQMQLVATWIRRFPFMGHDAIPFHDWEIGLDLCDEFSEDDADYAVRAGL